MVDDTAEKNESRREIPVAGESSSDRIARPAVASLDQRFAKLVEVWRRDTLHCSSIKQAVMHPAYQRIIGMGAPVIPLLLAELRTRPDHWFWALHFITGEEPAPVGASFDQAVQAWLTWGDEQGYLRS